VDGLVMSAGMQFDLSKRAGLQASKPHRFLFCVFFLVACVGVDACLVQEAGTVFALADF
jgi:hypothetical protein